MLWKADFCKRSVTSLTDLKKSARSAEGPGGGYSPFLRSQNDAVRWETGGLGSDYVDCLQPFISLFYSEFDFLVFTK